MIPYFRRRQPGVLFEHPMDPVPRTAILAPGFQETNRIRVFPLGWSDTAASFQPTSIAARLPVLHPLAGMGLKLQHAVIVLTYEGEAGFSESDRDLLWRAFGVPIFEQYLSVNNRLLAAECDAHAGLHRVGDWKDNLLEKERCCCGSAAPRISLGSRMQELVELLS